MRQQLASLLGQSLLSVLLVWTTWGSLRTLPATFVCRREVSSLWRCIWVWKTPREHEPCLHEPNKGIWVTSGEGGSEEHPTIRRKCRKGLPPALLPPFPCSSFGDFTLLCSLQGRKWGKAEKETPHPQDGRCCRAAWWQSTVRGEPGAVGVH